MSIVRYWTVLILTLANCTAQGLAQTECVYTYIQQPPNSLNCNPWPIIALSHDTLTLRCDIVGPRNDEAPDIQWFRYQPVSGRVELQLGGPRPKYTGPVSSGDLGELYKRINFTLNVLDTNEADTGCYWCMIRTEFSNCSFEMRTSNVFCLRNENSYHMQPSCTSQPTNTSIACAANTTCDEQGFPVLFESTTSITNMPATSTIIPSSSKLLARSTVATAVPISQPQLATTSHRVTNTVTVQSQSLQLVPTNSQSQHHMLPTPSPSQQPTRDSKQPPDTTRIRLGLYAGAAVCGLLLIIIVMLLVSVIVLCSKKSPQRTAARSGGDEGCTSPEGMVAPTEAHTWYHQEEGPTSMVNSESSIHLIPSNGENKSSKSEPPPLPPKGQHQDIDMPLVDLLSPMIDNKDSKRKSSLSQTLPLRVTPKAKVPGRSNTITLMESREQPLSGHTAARQHTQHHHRLSLQTPEHRSHDHISRHSPEPHYYHVLEKQDYYNWWAESEGRDLLMQNWGVSPPPLHRRPEQLKHSDRDYEDIAPTINSDGSSYHWEVQPVSGLSQEAASEQRQHKQSLRKNPYKRLEASMMEPSREYAKVSITSTSNGDS